MKEFVGLYYEFYHKINNVFKVKHILQFGLGIAAGMIGFQVLGDYGLAEAILVLGLFSLLNQFFHKLFYQPPKTRVIIKTKEENIKEFNRRVRQVVDKAIEEADKEQEHN